MADEFDLSATDTVSGLTDIRGSLEGVDLSAERVSRTLTRAFANAVVSGKSFESTLKSIGLSLSNMALSAGLKPLQQGFGSLLGSLASSFTGAGNLAGIATPFADGGVVSRPTFFGSGNGLGLMGERGAEAIMPLARGPDGRLGLAASGASGRPVSVQVNISTPDADGFRKSQAQVSAALARAVARGHRSL